MARMFLAPAIAFDPASRRCDLVVQSVNGVIALAIDTTPATPLLVAVGTDARAEPDDTLPDGVTEASIAAGFNQRRGWPGDRLSTDGTRIGCRFWLLERSKLVDETLADAEDYASQGTAGFPARYGATVEVAATRPAANVMQLQIQAAGYTLALKKAFP